MTPRSDISVDFSKIVQNKLHFAVHGHTAAEVIIHRTNAESPMMGLTSFKGDHPILRDAKIAKNYLFTMRHHLHVICTWNKIKAR